jgi:acyl-coenzyme A synthetase/AMP-(fatty) acid ligase
MVRSFGFLTETWAQVQPQGIAIDGPRGTVTYAMLQLQTLAWSRWLHAGGVHAGGTVGVAVRDEMQHLLVTLALLRLGTRQVTLASHDTSDQHRYLCDRVGVTACLSDFNFSAPAGLPVLRLPAQAPDAPALHALDETDEGGIYLTGSGTTGIAKIIFFSQSYLAMQALRGYGNYRSERIYRTASVETNCSKRLRLYTLYLGGTCVLEMGKSIHAMCREHHVTWLELATFNAHDCVRASQILGPLPDYTNVHIGGARVPIELRKVFTEKVSRRLHVSYGASEVGGIALCSPDNINDARETVGRQLPCVSLEIVDDADRPVPKGEVGHVRLKSSGMAQGYVGNEDASRHAFRNGWFYPSDMARMDADGYVVMMGRLDNLMVLNGITVYPADIERVLESFPQVMEATCIPMKSPTDGGIPVAVVILHAGQDTTAAVLLKLARHALGVRAPCAIHIVTEFPRSSQGKVVKRVLAELF